jgi:hypothetical protein
MFLARNGIDVFYVDESGDRRIFVVTSVTIPFLRLQDDRWAFEWDDYLDAYRDFRRELSKTHGVPLRKELHTQKLVSGRGRYRKGRPGGNRFGKTAAAGVYLWTLRHLDFLPPRSVMSVVADDRSNLYGRTRLQACLYALFQRMQRACHSRGTNGLTFFDHGHGENLRIYRMARRYLPTGSMFGSSSTRVRLRRGEH